MRCERAIIIIYPSTSSFTIPANGQCCYRIAVIIQYDTVQYSTVKYSTIQYSTISTIQHKYTRSHSHAHTHIHTIKHINTRKHIHTRTHIHAITHAQCVAHSRAHILTYTQSHAHVLMQKKHKCTILHAYSHVHPSKVD